MNKHIEVIGIDHGWSNMKTATQIFTTGVKEITTEPAFYDDVVELDGKYYKVGGKRLEVRDTKVENDNFYLLTLAAVAKELNRRGMRNADVLLSVGLPLTRFGAEKQDFIDYLSKKKEVAFRFEKERYTATMNSTAGEVETTSSCVFWLTEKANYQEFVSERPSADPVHAYFKVKTENIGYGEIVKTDESSGVKLKGAVYGIYSDSGCTNRVDTMTTDGNGYAKSNALVAGTYYVTRPRQHRHLKRKDSIRFLVLLFFSCFFIYTGYRKELAPSCRTRVKIYSKAAMPLSNLSDVSGNTPLVSDSRLLHGSVFGYKISICTQILRSWLPHGYGNAARLNRGNK